GTKRLGEVIIPTPAAHAADGNALYPDFKDSTGVIAQSPCQRQVYLNLGVRVAIRLKQRQYLAEVGHTLPAGVGTQFFEVIQFILIRPFGRQDFEEAIELRFSPARGAELFFHSV